MKKNYIALLFSLTIITSAVKTHAAMQMVTVANNVFTPSNFTINTGDSIFWSWAAGNHTTTSTLIPSGAASWNNNINSNAQGFLYVATVAGTYNYHCVFHGSMNAIFTVNSGVGLASIDVTPQLSLISSNYAGSSDLNITYSIPTVTKVNLIMRDILGNTLQTIAASVHAPGAYTKSISTADLPKGIYLLELVTSEARVSKKIVVQ